MSARERPLKDHQHANPPTPAVDDFADGPDLPPAIDPSVIVVAPRPGGFSPLFLPLLVVTLGGLFLGYRATADDWRGFSFDRLVTWALPAPEPDPVPAPVVSAPAPSAAPAPAAPQALALNTEVPKPPVARPPLLPETGPAAAAPAKEKAEAVEVDPLEDIRLEAEKTKQRIAELEKLKDEENRKFAANENQRKRDDRGFAGRRLPPDEIRKMIDAHQRRFERQIEQLEAMQGRLGMGMNGGGPGLDPATAQKRVKEFRERWGVGGPLGPDTNAKLFMGLPENGGTTVFQEFRRAGGSHTFVIRKQFRTTERLKPGDVPPPPPAPAVRD